MEMKAGEAAAMEVTRLLASVDDSKDCSEGVFVLDDGWEMLPKPTLIQRVRDWIHSLHDHWERALNFNLLLEKVIKHSASARHNDTGISEHGNFLARRKRTGCCSFLPGPRTLFFYEIVDCVCQACGYRVSIPYPFPKKKTYACGHGIEEVKPLCRMCYDRSPVVHPSPGKFKHCIDGISDVSTGPVPV
uniref:DUF3615 domain-containing protein n=1 Tax=Leersia perrieri TaxID=77586 RepID=A0A0D9VNI0_9ORYZ